MMRPSRLDCPLRLKTPNMGNTDTLARRGVSGFAPGEAQTEAERPPPAIRELDVPSYRTGAAQKRLQQEVYQQK